MQFYLNVFRSANKNYCTWKVFFSVCDFCDIGGCEYASSIPKNIEDCKRIVELSFG
jgi:hypothetical protein